MRQNQRTILLGSGGLLLAAVALGYWGMAQLGEKQAEAVALAEKMGNPALAVLLADPGGVARASREGLEIRNLEKVLRAEDGAWADGWAAETLKMSGEGQDWSTDPGKWKDRLIAVESDLQKAAVRNRVQLGPDFYLGLEVYREKNPAVAEVPRLALQLSVAERLVRLLFEARKVAEQYPTPCVLQALSCPEPAPIPTGEGAVRKTASAPVGPERITFGLEIQCSPEVLYEYVRLLALDSSLLILTDLKVSNEKQNFPLRSEIATRLSNPAGSPGGDMPAGKSGKKLLEILAGEESLKVSLGVEFVAWREPKATQGTPPPTTAR